MAGPENRHCANCIGALSFPICHESNKLSGQRILTTLLQTQ